MFDVKDPIPGRLCSSVVYKFAFADSRRYGLAFFHACEGAFSQQ